MVLTDHLNSTDKILNISNSILSTTDYLPYGTERLQTGTQSLRKYIGEQLDSTTGLNYLNARYYDSGRGQFTSQDPVFWELGTSDNGKKALLNPQSQNSYAYSLNNPLTYKDPDGEFVPLLLALSYIIGGLEIAATAYTVYSIADMGSTVAGTYFSQAPQEDKSKVYAEAAEQIGQAANLQMNLGNVGVLAKTESRILQNAKQGKVFADKQFKLFAQTQDMAAQEVTIKTNGLGIKVRVDAIGKNNCSGCTIEEYKSSAKASLTKNQKLGFPDLIKTGGTVVGNGKQGFPTGFQVSASTPLTIKRP